MNNPSSEKAPLCPRGDTSGDMVRVTTPVIPGWTTFGQLTQNGRSYKGHHLPTRLRGPFLDTPWPLHRLGDRIIDTGYVPLASQNPEAPKHTLEILDDTHLALDGLSVRIHDRATRMYNLNVLLLTRGFRLRKQDLAILSESLPVATKKQMMQPYGKLIGRLSGPQTIERVQDPERNIALYQLNPGLTIVDRRIAPLQLPETPPTTP
ncbi:MAG TPA: hypothetical protein VLF43_03775 [Candidatus Saccharimonadales bacterium]|nr:hypothetical protein [Candidatus Saccharimonadales bacterium]